MDTFINSEDPDEMPHYAAFHQGLYCLLGKKDLQTKKTNTTFKNYNLTPQGMYVQWPIQSLLHQTRRKDPFVYTVNCWR